MAELILLAAIAFVLGLVSGLALMYRALARALRR